MRKPMVRVMPSKQGVDAMQLAERLSTLLEESSLLTMATVDDQGVPDINAAYYVTGGSMRLTILTELDSRHARNLVRGTGACAVTVFDSRQQWGSYLRGVQLFGTMRQTTGARSLSAFMAYARRYAGLVDWVKAYDEMERISGSRFFEFSPYAGKLLDEVVFGKEEYIEFEVLGD